MEQHHVLHSNQPINGEIRNIELKLECSPVVILLCSRQGTRTLWTVQLAVQPVNTRFGDIPPSISDIPDRPRKVRFGDIPPLISDIPDKSGEETIFWIQT